MRELSRYNVAFSINDGAAYFVFNTLRRSGTFVPDYPALAASLADNGNGAWATGIEELRTQGIVVERRDTERKELLTRVAFERYPAESFLGLTVCPTLKCPLSCPYCYQRKPSASSPEFPDMSRATEKQLLRFIERHLPARTGLSIIWYGGEPLLRLKQIARISERAREMCESLDKPYLAGMVSSGWRLTDTAISTLAEACAVKWIQITLEMPPERHRERRLGPGGKNTLRKIASAARSASEHMLVHLRLNVDLKDSDEESSRAIRDFLRQEGFLDSANIDLAPCPVDWSAYEAADTALGVQVDSTYAGAQQPLRLQFQRLKDSLLDSKQSYDRQLLETQWQKLVSLYRRGSCCATRRDAFVVAPDGKLHKCWNTLGHDGMEVGDIWEGVSLAGRNFSSWMAFDPGELADCLECAIFPVCLGGCRFYRLHGYPKADYLCLRGVVEALAEIAAHCANRRLGFERVQVELLGGSLLTLPEYLIEQPVAAF